MPTIETAILIKATPDKVWAILTDFSAYPRWNPFITELAGQLYMDAPLEVELSLTGQSPMRMQPKVVQYEAGRTFAWLGHLWRPGIFDGEHIFELIAEGDTHTRLVQREHFTGILARPLLWLIGRKTRAGFVAMNEALREQVKAECASDFT